MYAGMNLFSFPSASEIGPIALAAQSADAGQQDGESSFQLLLFRTLTQEDPLKALNPASDTEEQDESLKEIFRGLMGLRLPESGIIEESAIQPNAEIVLQPKADDGIEMQAEEVDVGLAQMVPAEVVIPQTAGNIGAVQQAIPESGIQQQLVAAEGAINQTHAAADARGNPGDPAIPKCEGTVPSEQAVEASKADIPQGVRDGQQASVGLNRGLEETVQSVKPIGDRKAAAPEAVPLSGETSFEKVIAQSPQTALSPEAPLTTTGSTEKMEAYSQIGREIQFALEQKGPMEFKMQLQPKDLGQIDVKLRINEGKLIIDIMAASAKTQALLAGQVDKLIAGMGLQDVQIETVNVNQQAGRQGGEGQQSGFQQQPENRQNESGSLNPRYAGHGQGHEKNDQTASIRKNNFVRMDYTI